MITPDALSNLRHELRTPLNHIIGFSESLLEEPGAGALVLPLERVLAEAREFLSALDRTLPPSATAEAIDRTRIAAELSPALGRLIECTEALRAAPDADPYDEVQRICRAARQLASLVAFRGPSDPAPRSADDGQAADRRGTILVVDDNEGNRELLSRRLGRQGHAVELAADGRSALKLMRRRPVDLVLLDVMMPEMDGYEVLKRLKSDDALRHIPVLMISARDEIEGVIRCIELGAEDYLPKPFNAVLLKARINACLEKKRLRDREAHHLRTVADWNRTLEQRVQEQVTQLERLSRLKRFFSPQIAELILKGGVDDPLKTRRRDITAVFLDLRGFTAFAETSEPEDVMAALREYHGEMGKLIVAHEGTLEHFAGDGMMIFFNDALQIENSAERAVRMALEMSERVRALSAEWRKRGFELALGIGIAQGYATIGAIGFEGRWEYGAIGTVTNLAARLCAEAKSGQTLATSRVVAGVQDSAEVEEIGDLALKGLHRPVKAFSIKRLKSGK
ncbi:MAG TPA: response regulator [Stellaceae bacterium]|nr:response regulator [Stellaceae bacterium]